MELKFYKRPFKLDEYGTSWVYDAKGNFVFQFEKGAEHKEEVIFSLNALDKEPIKELNLSVGTDPVEIRNNAGEFITIRGWGGLTGVGGYGFSAEKASKIQDEFRDWIIYKLS